MSSNYTGDSSGATLTIALPEDSDSPSAALFRVPYERLLDNDASQNAIARQVLLRSALIMRALSIENADPVTDTAESCGAARRTDATPIVLGKTAQSFQISDWGVAPDNGTLASITSLVTDAATDGSRILFIGTGGNRCTYTDDDGNLFSAGGDIGSTPKRLVWSEAGSRFLVTCGTDDVKFSTDGTAWTAATTDVISPVGGLAVLSSGVIVGIEQTAEITFKRSTNNGVSFNFSSTIPAFADTDEGGTVAGNNGALVYHAARLNSGASIQISSSADGVTWNIISSLSPPVGCTFSARPRIMMCQNTGLLVVAAPTNPAVHAGCARTSLYGSLDGENWVGPVVVFSPNNGGVDAFAVAGGRLLASLANGYIAAADGLIG